MSNRRTDQQHRDAQSSLWIKLRNMIRRVAITETVGGLWSYAGFETLDGEETEEAPVFAGMGVYCRPGADDNPEGVLVHIGSDSDHGVFVAVRNEDARRRYVEAFGDVEPGELALFNSASDARLIITTDGQVRIESATQGAVSLALKSDVDALAAHVDSHVHLGVPHAITTVGPSIPSAPSAEGTSVLLGE
jgi:phage gp45-like